MPAIGFSTVLLTTFDVLNSPETSCSTVFLFVTSRCYLSIKVGGLQEFKLAEFAFVTE